MKNRKFMASGSRCGICIVHRRTATCSCIVFAVILAALTILAAFMFVAYYNARNEELIKLQKSCKMRSYFEKLVHTINDSPVLKWKARYNPFGFRPLVYNVSHSQKFMNGNETLTDKVIDDLYKFYKSNLMHHHIRELAGFPAERLPRNFDAREKWPLCSSIHNVPNQGGCGSCFAVAAAGVASDRTCIATNGTVQVVLSADDIIACCDGCGDCYGGDSLKALVYWVNEGLVTGGRDGCRPYPYDIDCGVPCSPLEFVNGAERRKCHRQCQNIYYRNDYSGDKHHASIAYSMAPRIMISTGRGTISVPSVTNYISAYLFNNTLLADVQALEVLKKELYLFGPMTMAFPVTEEFLHYSSGIYSPYPEKGFHDRFIFWHVVRLIGWAYDADGLFYWIAVNSFGRQWGESGLFRIDIRFLEKFGLEYEAAML